MDEWNEDILDMVANFGYSRIPARLHISRAMQYVCNTGCPCQGHRVKVTERSKLMSSECVWHKE